MLRRAALQLPALAAVASRDAQLSIDRVDASSLTVDVALDAIIVDRSLTTTAIAALRRDDVQMFNHVAIAMARSGCEFCFVIVNLFRFYFCSLQWFFFCCM